MQPSPANALFGRIALHNKLITQEQLNRAIAEIAANPGMRLGDALIHLGYMAERHVQKVLEAQQAILEKRKAAAAAQTAEPEPPPPAQAEPTDAFDFSRIEQYLHFARKAGASDLHIAVGSPPSVRMNGEVQFLSHESFTAQDTEDLFRGLLSEAQMQELTEHKSVEFCMNLGDADRYRVCIFKQRNGYDGSFRVIPQQIDSVSELGFPESVLRLTEYHQGMVLVTGPSGHGKSTTLAALVEHVNQTRADHVITIEDPIEQVLRSEECMITQREVSTHTASFGAALRAALREDPDIIVLGELRDLETISLAITAAETGHLVFGTTHTTSAMRTIGRILDVFPPDQQPQVRAMMSESLKGIISQYLVPRADGNGRALAYELLVNTTAIANLIRDNRVFQIRGQMQAGKKSGMVLMDESLVNLVRQKIVSKEMAMSFADDPKAFLMEVERES